MDKHNDNLLWRNIKWYSSQIYFCVGFNTRQDEENAWKINLCVYCSFSFLVQEGDIKRWLYQRRIAVNGSSYEKRKTKSDEETKDWRVKQVGGSS